MTKKELMDLGYRFKKFRGSRGVRYISVSLHGEVVMQFPNRNYVGSKIVGHAAAHWTARRLLGQAEARLWDVNVNPFARTATTVTRELWPRE